MSECDAFAREFRALWDAPTADGLAAMLQPDVRLVQPASPTVVGRENARQMFHALLSWLPDLRGEVNSWSGSGDLLFIEFRLMATVGGRRVEWPVVDRLRLRNGLVQERVSYFDPSALVGAVLRHPSTWLGYLRTRRASAR